MQQDDALYLGHMRDMARKASVRASELNRDEYESDDDVQLSFDTPSSVVYNGVTNILNRGKSIG